ncbi:MAG: AAA family ATPase [Desulfovibrionaceae bacterium]|nr:AAA family ATPase [Desulfovibrionaceae bacterium]
MLDYLRIRDLALIEDMELEFAPGMNVLTGETGAGKSFILKALGFLLGDRLTSSMVRPGRERAQVEALFTLPEREIILRRELLAGSGRSRLYINDQLSSQESVRELRNALILHTSQHGQHRLLQPAFQARLIDEAMGRPDLLEARDAVLKELHELSEQRNALRKKFQSLADRRDLLEMQQREIDAVDPEPGEEERLETLRVEAREAAGLAENYDQALQLLHGDDAPGLLDMLAQLERVLHDMSRLDESLVPDMEAVSGLRQNLSHLERRLRRPPERLSDIDTDAIEARLFALAQLKRKLHRSLDEIVGMRSEIAENLSFLDVCALDLKRLDREEAALHERLRAVLAELLPARRAAGTGFARALEKELAGLGFSEQVRVEVLFTPTDICSGIQDERPRILWAPNPGQLPQPLDKIASGGELSRFLLALVGIQSGAETATYIFDEVDAGVGGLTLNRVAERLETLASHRQMLLITHWPQLAAHATRHFQITKVIRDQETFTLCSQLDDTARMEELARMAGGGEQGKALARTLKE